MGPQALAALGWLGKVVEAIKKIRARVARRVIKVKAYVADLIKLEQETGAETAAWERIHAAAAAGVEVTLTAEEVAYLDEFKDLWNLYFKKPLAKVAELVDDEKVTSVLNELDGTDDD